MSDKILCSHDDPTWCTDRCLTKKDFKPKEPAKRIDLKKRVKSEGLSASKPISEAMMKEDAEKISEKAWRQEYHSMQNTSHENYAIGFLQGHSVGEATGYASRDAEVVSLRSTQTELVELLKKLEWHWHMENNTNYCPDCGASDDKAEHFEACSLENLLAKHRKQSERNDCKEHRGKL